MPIADHVLCAAGHPKEIVSVVSKDTCKPKLRKKERKNRDVLHSAINVTAWCFPLSHSYTYMNEQ